MGDILTRPRIFVARGCEKSDEEIRVIVQPSASKWEVIRWWELRRVPYNLAVGAIGVASLLVMELIGQTIIQPGEDFEEPLGIMFGTIAFGLAANVCYTFGWLVELVFIKGDSEQHAAFRKRYFRLGFGLSCALATLPVWLAALSWCINKFHLWPVH